MKLYIYDHCPFCTRARLIFGLKNLPLDTIFLANDDEATPVGLIGKKMVPILVKDDGSAMGESLDIVHYVDAHSGGGLEREVRPEWAAWLEKVDAYQRQLVWPRCVRLPLPEFATASAIDYFVSKKSAVIGNFAQHLADSAPYIAQLNQDLQALAELLAKTPGWRARLSEEDILLFPLLRNLSMVKGVTWPAPVADYMQHMATRGGVALFCAQAVSAE